MGRDNNSSSPRGGIHLHFLCLMHWSDEAQKAQIINLLMPAQAYRNANQASGLAPDLLQRDTSLGLLANNS